MRVNRPSLKSWRPLIMPAAKLSYSGSAQAVLHLGAFTAADMAGNHLPERKIDFDVVLPSLLLAISLSTAFL
jgi:hypothetical protein